MATMALFTFRADCGHIETQRIQEMHFLPSVSLGSSVLIACAGHISAQIPHALQLRFAFGTSPAGLFIRTVSGNMRRRKLLFLPVDLLKYLPGKTTQFLLI